MVEHQALQTNGMHLTGQLVKGGQLVPHAAIVQSHGFVYVHNKRRNYIISKYWRGFLHGSEMPVLVRGERLLGRLVDQQATSEARALSTSTFSMDT